MELIRKVLANFLKQADIWFFYGFLLTFTLSIRKVLFFYPIRGQFNEYTGIYLYLSDVFILLMLINTGIVILYNKLSNKSIYKTDFKAYLKQKIVIIPFLLIVFSFISVDWSGNWRIALSGSIKLIEFYLLYLWVIFRLFHPHNNVPRGTFLNNVFLIIIGTGIIQSIIAIWQFIIQKSLGLFWLKESLISPEIAGVAKVIFNGDKYIRAYGLFPHPNILGGFLVLSIILTILYFKLFYACSVARKCSIPVKMFHVEHLTGQAWNNSYYIILGIQALALILTFSKSAWIGLIISLIYLYYVSVSPQQQCSTSIRMFHPDTNVPPRYECSTWNILRGRRAIIYIKKLFHVEQFKNFSLIAGIILLLIVLIKPNWYSIVGKSIQDRMFYLNVSRGTFLENPILGVGAGNFVDNMLKNYPNLEIWQYQPVHNVFLLILNELGIIGFILFVWFVWEVIKDKMFCPDTNVPPQYNCSTWNNLRGRRGTFYGAGAEQFICYQSGIFIKAIFIGFLFIMLFDHYFWDIQQGQIMLWLVLGFLAGDKLCTTNESTDLSTGK